MRCPKKQKQACCTGIPETGRIERRKGLRKELREGLGEKG